MNRILFGGRGYLGGRLAQHLRRQGHKITITTRRADAAIPAWAAALGRVVSVDPSKKDALAPLIDDHSILIHLAGPDENEAATNPKEALAATEKSLRHLL